ncbi:helix-turn-helix domain-containing protein [Pseudonocardia humida]|uniref:Helix-turn-helix transcriptional regulator n=1 Tax=Pseudonocardia humida TaxID=2800819 RepID=A0ABT1A0M9_9PSEU|nr:AraC family transcriptional regulator [Pseudonocardia humida]MCO1656444.1 helix-turn-helix transcriptional regulator [Pseudonocardia humida]
MRGADPAARAAWYLESERHSWRVPHRPPHPRMRHYVARDYEGSTEQIGSHRLLLPATTSVTLVVKVLDSPFRPPEFVRGPADAFHLLDGVCAPAYLQIMLTPLGAYQLLGVPLDELRGRVADLRDVLGPDSAPFADRVRDAPTWRQRFAIVDEVLGGRAAAATRPSPEVARAWSILVASGGRERIGRIAAEVGWSHKHLTRRFTTQVGLAPKAAARVIRFGRAVNQLGRGAPSLARLAAESGYADQAHLTRDFRSLAGVTPGDFLTRLRAATRPAAAASAR